jgi:hypothetical protein
VQDIQGGWRLFIEPGPAGDYRLAQLDNYGKLKRSAFPHRAPFMLHLRVRTSHSSLPGTWGFGLWNDPFGFSLGFGGNPGRLPALPNAAWFFFASPENHLSLHADQPGHGSLAGSFHAAQIPTLLMAPAALALPLLWLPAASRLLRRQATSMVRHDWKKMSVDPSGWHHYEIHWSLDQVLFKVDGEQVHAAIAPQPPLGLVLWLDNQYAAWRPDGSFGYGTLATPADCWMEVCDVQVGSN